MRWTLELTGQWDRMLELEAVGLVTCVDFESMVGATLGRFRAVVDELH